jgi:hypothetical protein
MTICGSDRTLIDYPFILYYPFDPITEYPSDPCDLVAIVGTQVIEDSKNGIEQIRNKE